MKDLLNYNFPDDLNEMSEKDLELLSYQIRDFLIEKVSNTGGHLASNLGVVELTIALHTVYNSPVDKIIWDVGHQSYVHKILTGRAGQFDQLRQFNGLSGFPKREESPHDVFESGHSSNSLSIAFGMAKARDLKGDESSVIAVIGDGALTGGVAYEALNNIGNSGTNLIAILNDNEMSISKNMGGVSHHLTRLRGSRGYNDFKKKLHKALNSIPGVGNSITSSLEHIRDTIKYAVVPGALFETLGFRYFGPIDGHNLAELLEILNLTKSLDGPILLHVVTKKGKGYISAEKKPDKFHGIGPFDKETGEPINSSSKLSYSNIFGETAIDLAANKKNVVAVSAAMVDATGLRKFSEIFPEKTFDAGIAEQHAVTFAAGMALSGFTPIVAVYSTFLQRAYDQILVEVCLQKLPVIFAIDRAGVVGADGETHHGIFDLAYLQSMPNMTIMAPKDGLELSKMLKYAYSLQSPCAIRYPKGNAADFSSISENYVIDGCAEVLFEGKDITIIALGKMVENAVDAHTILKEKGIHAEIINARFVKPLDKETIISSILKTKKVITIEDHSIKNGFGAEISLLLQSENITGIDFEILSWPDRFIEQGNCSELENLYGLDAESIAKKAGELVER